MKGRSIFLSYASGSFTPERDALCNSALAVGFDEARARGPNDIDPNFAREHHEILSQSRGGGFWLWKPQLILQELRSLEKDDVLVYSDAGRSPYYRFSRFPKQLIFKAREKGFLLGPTIGQHGPMSHWTKRDAFVLLGMDQPEIHDKPPIQATWSLWTPTLAAFDFLSAWIEACVDPRILTDIPNTQGLPDLPGFRDHRHDQTVLSILAYSKVAPHLNYSRSLVERLLKLRPQSRLAHLFLKRIDDAEALETMGLTTAIHQSWKAIKASKHT